MTHPADHSTTAELGLAAEPGGYPNRDRPELRVDTEGGTIRALTEAINDGILPDVYVTNGVLCRLTRVSGDVSLAGQTEASKPPLPVISVPLTPDALASLLAHHLFVYQVKTKRNGDRAHEEVTPGQRTLAAVLSQRYWPNVRPLHGIIGAPALRPDGTLLQRAGYDGRTGLYLAPKVTMEPVPERPGPDDVDRARQFLLHDLLGNFPWVDRASRANYIALLVSQILRPYLRCLTPLGLISATTQGSGKTLLTDIVGYLFGFKGQTWTKNEAELRKAITSLLTGPHAVLVFDNLKEGTAIDSPVLADLLTSDSWSDRVLGTNTTFEAPNDRLWLANGNNIRIGGDVATRTVLVGLRPMMARPELRTDFEIPDLNEWIKDPDNRAVLLRHLLILVMDWIQCGALRAVIAMRNYSTWARAAGGFCTHHGIDGFLENVQDVRELDDEDAQWTAFLGRWVEIFGTERKTTADLRKSADLDMANGYDRWGGDFITDDDGKVPNSKSLGRLLLGQIGRFHGQYRLENAMESHKKVRIWWVEESES